MKLLMRFVNDVPSIRWLKPTAIIVGGLFIIALPMGRRRHSVKLLNSLRFLPCRCIPNNYQLRDW
jgi:hypothetical protein